MQDFYIILCICLPFVDTFVCIASLKRLSKCYLLSVYVCIVWYMKIYPLLYNFNKYAVRQWILNNQVKESFCFYYLSVKMCISILILSLSSLWLQSFALSYLKPFPQIVFAKDDIAGITNGYTNFLMNKWIKC